LGEDINLLVVSGCSNQNSRFYQGRVFSFLTPILSACILTSSLIHKAILLWKSFSSFLEHHLSVQISYLIKKGLLKHAMHAMVYGYQRKENS
jgi:hypothetical protein